MNIARNIHNVRYLSRKESFFILKTIEFQQQFVLEPEQSHVGSVFLRIPFIIPAAQPTPDFTVIAPGLQFNAQAPHSMQ
jgi:hypothetical protein